MNLRRAVLVAFCLIGGVGLQADPSATRPSLKADFQQLLGKWKKQTGDLTFEINFDGHYVQVAASGSRPSNFATSGVGSLTSVKEDSRGRYIELEPHTAAASGLPQKIPYHFEQDTLVFDVSSGPMAGKQRLERSTAFRPDPAVTRFEFAIGVLAAVLLLAGAVTLLLLQRRKRPA